MTTQRDTGDLAEVPEDQRLDQDPPDDNGLGETGAEDLSDVPDDGEVVGLEGGG